jgi:hypothetical protein
MSPRSELAELADQVAAENVADSAAEGHDPSTLVGDQIDDTLELGFGLEVGGSLHRLGHGVEATGEVAKWLRRRVRRVVAARRSANASLHFLTNGTLEGRIATESELND